MIIIACVKCASALRIAGDFDEVDHLVGKNSEWYPNDYPCWKDCGGSARFITRVDPDALRRLDVRDLTPQEAFLAFHQMGLPEERDCSAAAVVQLFKEQAVKRVLAVQIQGSHRCVIDHIEMESGSKVYFASGPEGAVVVRISKPHSYAKEALREHQVDPRT